MFSSLWICKDQIYDLIFPFHMNWHGHVPMFMLICHGSNGPGIYCLGAHWENESPWTSMTFNDQRLKSFLLQPDHALRILINLNVWILYIIQDLHELHIDPPVDKHPVRSLSCLGAVPGPCWYAWQQLPKGPKSTLICAWARSLEIGHFLF